MGTHRVAVVGAGIAGLVAALDLAARGLDVVVLERMAAPGGKMREVEVAGRRIDAGPTVFTMRWVFEEIFSAAGASFADRVHLMPAERLARHAWSEHERLDLYADLGRSAEAIGELAGPAESRRFVEFSERARRIYDTLREPFLRSPKPSVLALMRGVGKLGELWGIQPFSLLWGALGEHFGDARLQQLFGRYATYCGSSPFLAPATLMLVAHVEREGVWFVGGGMQRLAEAVAGLAAERGATFRYGAAVREVVIERGRATGVVLASGERIAADAVVMNADVAALAEGRFGRAAARGVSRAAPDTRSLSAVTWALVAQAEGFPLAHHNVFFSRNYATEFDDIFRGRRLPAEPTVYVCAQDRGNDGNTAPQGAERLLCLINAPPVGDSRPFDATEIEPCEQRTFSQLNRCGLKLTPDPAARLVTTPAQFEQLFPATGGALYGQASHGWMASFRRPGVRSSLRGLYLAGGSTHPGPGVPMAALSGRLAAGSVIEDLTSRGPSRTAATPGGTSMR